MYDAPVPRALLTWSDAGVEGPRRRDQAARPASDRGPVLRLLDQEESRYDAAWILTVPAGEKPAERLANAVRERVARVEVRPLEIDDPSDYKQIFRVVRPLIAALKRALPEDTWSIDVLLSAGTPQTQTIWVVMVQAGLLPARMLQVIPALFVGKSHPRAIREVRLDIEGFPEIRALRAEVARLRAAVQARAIDPRRRERADAPPPIARWPRVAATDVARARARRDGHRQGAGRARPARGERARPGALRGGELRSCSPRV